VTFIFTDIVGSTSLLRRLGDTYETVLDQHRAVLRSAWSTYAGREVHVIGDGSLVAFANASAAVLACACAQRRLRKEQWLANAEIHVRMGVHAGPARARHGDYVSLAVHQAARIVSLAGTDQVLVSERVATAADDLTRASLTPVGLFQLRDFDEPVTIFEVRHELCLLADQRRATDVDSRSEPGAVGAA
jgi:class 3 adenylate cyclase